MDTLESIGRLAVDAWRAKSARYHASRCSEADWERPSDEDGQCPGRPPCPQADGDNPADWCEECQERRHLQDIAKHHQAALTRSCRRFRDE